MAKPRQQPKNWVSYREIKEKISLLMVLERYGVKLKKSGQNLAGCCPLHNGSNPRQFSVSPEKNAWRCFGNCDTGGNVLDLVALKEFGAKDPEHIREAALLLKNWFLVGGASDLPAKPDQPAPGTWTEGETGNKLIRKEKEEPGREDKASEAKSAKVVNPPLKFALKNLNPDHPFFEERGIAPETVKRFGLGFCSKGMMNGRIAIPIHDHEGQLVAYCGRAVSEEQAEAEGKYKLPPKFVKSEVVYNLHRLAGPLDFLILVESYISVWKLSQGHFGPVVALMGASLSKTQEKLILGLLRPSGRVLLLFDADGSGKACTDDCLGRLGRHVFVKAADISEYAKKPHQLTPEQLKKLIP